MKLLQQALYQIVQPLTGETVIFTNQNGPRPALPYWTIQLLNVNPLGSEYSQGVDNSGNQTVKVHNQATVSLNRFGLDSMDKVSELNFKLYAETSKQKFSAKKIGLGSVLLATDAPYSIDGLNWESRAVFDFNVSFGAEYEDLVGIIESVDVASTIEGQDLQIDHIVLTSP